MGSISSIEKARKSSTNSQESINDNDYDASWLDAVHNSYVFVWCDKTIGLKNNIEDDKNTLSQLAQIVSQHRQLVHTFNETDACREFISSVNNVCLIVSGGMGQELVPLIHNHDQVHSIYIFCLNKQKHEAWSAPYKKVRGVFTDIRSVCDSIQSTIAPSTVPTYDPVEFDVVPAGQNSSSDNQQEVILIYSKLTQMLLYKMAPVDRGRREMIQYCHANYTSEHQTTLINEFERNYSKHNPSWWYTRNSFLQSIINGALNKHDLYALCCFSRFLTDLNAQLVQLQNSSKATSRSSLVLYFSTMLTVEEFNRLQNSVGGLLSINKFISANSERGIALMMINQQLHAKKNDGKIRVLFQISIDQSVRTVVAYGNIGAISQFVHEKEYMISMGSIYRIDSIEHLPEKPSGYVINLTLINANDMQYNHLTQCIQREQWEEEVNLVELGANLTKKFHLFRSANDLFRRALRLKRKEFRYIMLHYNMAAILACMDENEKALEEYRYALTLVRHHVPNGYTQDDPCLIPLYSQMALAYQQEHRFTYAIEHAFRALGIATKFEEQTQSGKEIIAACYHNLGVIHDHEKKYSDARKFYEQALMIRQEYLPLGHEDITVLQRSITVLTDKTSDYESL